MSLLWNSTHGNHTGENEDISNYKQQHPSQQGPCRNSSIAQDNSANVTALKKSVTFFHRTEAQITSFWKLLTGEVEEFNQALLDRK